jgi:hypothetical protein
MEIIECERQFSRLCWRGCSQPLQFRLRTHKVAAEAEREARAAEREAQEQEQAAAREVPERALAAEPVLVAPVPEEEPAVPTPIQLRCTRIPGIDI